MAECMIYRDKNGHYFEVKGYKSADYLSLIEMYDMFSPKARFQGMPPCDKEVCNNWLKGLISAGENYLAWREEAVIGHGVMLPDFEKSDAEYLVFVNQYNRGLGVGSALTRVAIKKAESLGLQNIWLTVNAYNFRATMLYKKCGFTFCDSYRSASERMMEYNCGCKKST